MSFIDRLFRSRRPTTKPITAADIEKIVHAYGDALASKKSGLADVSELPYPKSTIKAAMIAAIMLVDDARMKETLKVNLMALPDWQEGVGPGPHPFELALKEHDVVASAKAVSASGPSYMALQVKGVAEAKALLDELKSLGLHS